MDTSSGLTPLLIDAKKEYVGQLTDVLAPYVLNHVTGLYIAAQKADKRTAVMTFQKALREIPVWNSHTIQQHTSQIQNRYTFLGDLIAACFVAYVKILSSVKLHQQKPNIRLKLPANDTFVHKVYINAAREFYGTPALVHADKAAKLSLVRAAVEASVRDMLPIEDILKAYLGNTIDAEDNTMNPAEMVDDDAFQPASMGFSPPQQPPQPADEDLPPPPAFPSSFSAPHAPAPDAYQAPAQAPSQAPAPAPQALPEADDAPKQISLPPIQASSQPVQSQPQPHHQQPRPQEDLFSDAEDEL